MMSNKANLKFVNRTTTPQRNKLHPVQFRKIQEAIIKKMNSWAISFPDEMTNSSTQTNPSNNQTIPISKVVESSENMDSDAVI